MREETCITGSRYEMGVKKNLSLRRKVARSAEEERKVGEENYKCRVFKKRAPRAKAAEKERKQEAEAKRHLQRRPRMQKAAASRSAGQQG